MWNCRECKRQLVEPCEPCCHCGKPSGVPSNVVRAAGQARYLKQRYKTALASEAASPVLAHCQELIQQSAGVSINMPRSVLEQMLRTPKVRYINHHDVLRADMKTDVDRENKAKREGMDALLYGDDGKKLNFGALNLGSLGVYSYGEACVFLKEDGVRDRTSFMETNTYGYHKDGGDGVDILIEVLSGSRALWDTVGMLAVVKHEKDLLRNTGEWTLPRLAEVLIQCEGDKNTDRYVEAQIYPPITSEHIRRVRLDPSKARGPAAGGLIGEIEKYEREVAELLRQRVAPSLPFEVVSMASPAGSHP